MKKNTLLIFVCLMFSHSAFSDALSWTWEVSTLASTHTKTCTLAFSDSLFIDWGDGSKEWIHDSLSSKTLTHVYSSNETYSCSAVGSGVTYFKADSKRVLRIDTHAAPLLTYLNCTSCQVTSLDLTNNTELINLYCGGNKLTSLNLTHNLKLQTLTCSENQLSNLDISVLPVLKKVIAHTNPLTEIKVCSTGSLNYLSCLNCNLNAATLNQVFNALPPLTDMPGNKNLFMLNNPGSNSCQISLAISKNWSTDLSATKSSFYIPSVSSASGDSIQFDICLKNPIPAIAFELDLVLPDGAVLDTLRSRLTSTRKGNHILSIAKTSDSIMQYKILSYSMKNRDPFLRDSGSVLQLFMKAPVEENVYNIHIKNVMLIDTATNVLGFSVSDGTLNVKSTVLKGDTNGDKKVDVTDIVRLVAYINGRNPNAFDSTAADMDGNGVWNIADVTKMVVVINETDVEPSDSLIDESQRSIRKSGNCIFMRQPENDPSCLELCLDNKDTIQAYQVDILLPKGMSFSMEKSLQMSERAGSHLFTMSKISNVENRYRLLSYALRPETAILGDTGVIAHLSLVADEHIQPGIYSAKMEQPVLVGMNMLAMDVSFADAELHVPDPSEKIESILVGSAPAVGLWVRGTDLRRVSVLDISGKLLFERHMQGTNYFSTMLSSGIYFVKVCSSKSSVCVKKVVVR